MSVLLAGFYKIGPGVGLEKTCEAICRLLRFLQIQNIFNHDDLSQTKVDWSWSNIWKCKTDFKRCKRNVWALQSHPQTAHSAKVYSTSTPAIAWWCFLFFCCCKSLPSIFQIQRQITALWKPLSLSWFWSLSSSSKSHSGLNHNLCESLISSCILMNSKQDQLSSSSRSWWRSSSTSWTPRWWWSYSWWRAPPRVLLHAPQCWSCPIVFLPCNIKVINHLWW